jgi:hypothetical protein
MFGENGELTKVCNVGKEIELGEAAESKAKVRVRPLGKTFCRRRAARK